MSKLLKENVAEAPVKAGKRWRVIVAKPGQGSSGFYSEELFRRDAHKILAPGAQSFINHDDSRKPTEMIGTFPEGSYWDESEKAVVSELEVFSHWREFVEEVGPHCGMSIYAMGNADDDGNVIEILEDRLNGCDLVARPGLVGSGLAEKLYESAVAGSAEKPGSAPLQEKRKIEMDAELIARFEALEGAQKSIADALAVLVAEKKAAVESAAQVEADEKAVTAAVEAYDAQIAAIDAADLFPSQVESLRAEAKAGRDVAPLIEAAIKVKADAIEAAKSAPGVVVESAPVGRFLGESATVNPTDLGKVFG